LTIKELRIQAVQEIAEQLAVGIDGDAPAAAAWSSAAPSHSCGGWPDRPAAVRYRKLAARALGHPVRVPEDPFSEDFSFDIPLGPEDGNRAFFGTNVLQGLIDGIDDFVQERQPRWERRAHRIGAPVLLGCSPWVTDDALLTAIEKLPGACILINKAKSAPVQARIVRIQAVNSGFAARYTPQPPTGRIPLNHAENGSGKPRIRAPAKGATFRASGFQDLD
jgi:hypothetical protein